ncbi:Retrotransposable element Tf2 [Gossypium australe]|uniref:Retrotransposable element Tf2 n=1 Tax=Gossypium australe TaxID=47621 RepID=A0A5B6VM28_9ROSI|nr:Retrotransposable element Tf2 [Gossypium australe]
MSPFEALYGRKCQPPICWIKLSENNLVGLDVVREIEEKVMAIKNHIKIAQDRQKAYVDRRRKDVSYEVGSKVFLKRIELIAYRLALPPKLSKIHDVFHVSKLRRYHSDPDHVIRKVEEATQERESTMRD